MYVHLRINPCCPTEDHKLDLYYNCFSFTECGIKAQWFLMCLCQQIQKRCLTLCSDSSRFCKC